MNSKKMPDSENDQYDVLRFFRKYGTLVALGLTVLVFALFEPRFVSLLNFFNISRQIAVLFILGVAETYALIDGEIDQLYTDYCRKQLQSRLKDAIARRTDGLLTIRSSVLVPTGDDRSNSTTTGCMQYDD